MNSTTEYTYFTKIYTKRIPNATMCCFIIVILNIIAIIVLLSKLERMPRMSNLLSEKLRKLRLEKNFTQDYVAKYLNMTRQGYAHYEAGLRNPDYQTLLKLSNLYLIDIGDLINNFTTPINNMLQETPPYHATVKTDLPNTKKTIQLTYDERRLFNLFQKLTSTEKKELLSYLEQKIKSSNKNSK